VRKRKRKRVVVVVFRVGGADDASGVERLSVASEVFVPVRHSLNISVS
jgi:hypothetical protein